MIERITKRSEIYRFLGDEAEMNIHDLEKEDTAEQVCYIDKIFEKGNGIVFFLDTHDEAHRRGYDNCESCLSEGAFRLGIRLKIEK